MVIHTSHLTTYEKEVDVGGITILTIICYIERLSYHNNKHNLKKKEEGGPPTGIILTIYAKDYKTVNKRVSPNSKVSSFQHEK